MRRVGHATSLVLGRAAEPDTTDPKRGGFISEDPLENPKRPVAYGVVAFPLSGDQPELVDDAPGDRAVAKDVEDVDEHGQVGLPGGPQDPDEAVADGGKAEP